MPLSHLFSYQIFMSLHGMVHNCGIGVHIGQPEKVINIGNMQQQSFTLLAGEGVGSTWRDKLIFI